jgi:OHCU decarboxylase
VTGLAARMNGLSPDDAAAALRRCCGAERWVERMIAGRPYADDRALLEAADRAWWDLGREDWLQAFRAHPRIGERSADSWSWQEQAGVDGTGADIRRRLAAGNEAYEGRFGHVYLVCATGREAPELLADLETRLTNDPARELRVAATELAKIIRLRLEKLENP